MKKFLNNIEARAMPYIITVLLVGIAITGLFLIPQSPLTMSPASAAVATDYLYYKEITIDHTKVDGTLTNFPVWVYNTSSSFADNILTDGSDIAFFDSTKATRFNHEIEVWTKGTGELGVWVNITSISSSVDTVFYIYYGDSDTSDSRNNNPEDVWDSNYVAVFHLDGSQSTYNNDSTSYNNDMTSDAGTPDYQVIGQCGYGINFSDPNAYLTGAYDASLRMTDDITITSWVFLNVENTTDLNKNIVYRKSNYVLRYRLGYSSPNWYGGGEVFGTTLVNILSWQHFGGTRNNPTNNAYLNGVIGNTSTDSDAINPVTNEGLYIGNNGGLNYPIDAVIDEVRISNIERSGSWIGAVYNTTNSPSTFLTFGTQSGAAVSTYSIKGLSNDIITWDGTASSTVWCNSSGNTNEWLEVNMSINATDNVTVFRVWMDDLNNTGSTEFVNASNITMYVSSDNSSYGELGTFPDGGGNCTNDINATNWNAGTMGSDPFAGAGITDKTTSIYLLLKLTIPSGASTDEFWSTSSSACKIYLGHYT